MQRTTLRRACAILGTVAVLSTVGCGDDGDDEESSRPESSSSTTAPPTGEETTDRDEYVEQANEGCEEVIARFSELFPELSENPTDAEILAFAEVLVELNRAMITVFEELPVPEGDEDVIRSIIDGSIEATDMLEADPVSVFESGENPYEAVNTEIVAYGMSSCADSGDGDDADGRSEGRPSAKEIADSLDGTRFAADLSDDEVQCFAQEMRDGDLSATVLRKLVENVNLSESELDDFHPAARSAATACGFTYVAP